MKHFLRHRLAFGLLSSRGALFTSLLAVSVVPAVTTAEDAKPAVKPAEVPGSASVSTKPAPGPSTRRAAVPPPPFKAADFRTHGSAVEKAEKDGDPMRLDQAVSAATDAINAKLATRCAEATFDVIEVGKAGDGATLNVGGCWVALEVAPEQLKKITKGAKVRVRGRAYAVSLDDPARFQKYRNMKLAMAELTIMNTGELHVVFDRARSIYYVGGLALKASSPEQKIADWPQFIKQAIEKKKVLAGMTREQVVASWGHPTGESSKTIGSSVQDQLFYGSKSVIFLDDGIVTAVQE